ncbi:uncharacterized protein LOC114359695 isoform X2 [Ostrinia furnacalis]|uniref:uncharacterized protein LOC114359695 isoform X2 n=1 Tax=Ostrinia furnacalis TaxID=93504 RepID=UPI00103FF483|nr:uncharacterized protein LOC114359695 isoform X2 [Ostrinia furnacalis]
MLVVKVHTYGYWTFCAAAVYCSEVLVGSRPQTACRPGLCAYAQCRCALTLHTGAAYYKFGNVYGKLQKTYLGHVTLLCNGRCPRSCDVLRTSQAFVSSAGSHLAWR